MIFGGELGLPTIVPMEVALLLVGAYSVTSLPALLGGLALVIGADTAGTLLLYLAMLTGGRRLVGWLLRNHAQSGGDAMRRWRHRLHGHDTGLTFVTRAIPLVRMYVPVGAGLIGISPRAYLAGAVPGAAIWAGTPLVAGYLFRHDVHRIAATYTTVIHWLLLTVPALAILVVAVWWVLRAASRRIRYRRGRAVAGAVAVLGVGAFLIATALENDHLADRGAGALPSAVLTGWLIVISGIGVALLGIVIADVRATMTHAQLPARPRRAELIGAAIWIGLVSLASAIMIALEIFYPTL